MMTTDILPIRAMDGADWSKINSGFVITSSTDWLIPKADSYCDEIIEYLLHTNLKLSDYTDYDELIYEAFIYVAEPIYYHLQGVSILTENQKTHLNLLVYMSDSKRFAKVNKHEALRMNAQLFLDSTAKYLLNRDDFDGEKFYTDILPILQPIAEGRRAFRDEEFPF